VKLKKCGRVFLIFVIILCKKGVKKADFGQKIQKSGHHFLKNIGLFLAIFDRLRNGLKMRKFSKHLKLSQFYDKIPFGNI
jgi:hypothetical protein